MKHLSGLRVVALMFTVFIVSSCTDNLNLPSSAPGGSSLNGSGKSLATQSISPNVTQSFSSSSYEVTDASGTIHVKYFWGSTGAANFNSLSVPVDPNYVVVGGSAIAFYGSGVGAMLISSRPDFANNAWVGSSGDHIQADAHYLWVTAIGLRIDGMSASQLKSYMTVVNTTSSVAAGPSATVTLPSGYALLGGGAAVNEDGGAGNLMVSSMPTNSQNGWMASSQNQISSDPCSITVYAIGIQNPIPNFGSIVSWQSTYGPVSGGSGSYIINNNGFIGGWVPTCPGASSTHSSWGRMLSAIHVGPAVSLSTSGNGSASYLFDNLEWIVSEFFMNKDHIKADAGSLSGAVVRIQKQ